MVLDPQYLIDSIEQAAKEAVRESLDKIVARAKDKAPVRRIFADPTARRRGFGGRPIGVHTMQLNEQAGPAFRWASRAGVELMQPAGGSLAAEHEQFRGRGYYTPSRRRITGRINSYSPVLMSPAGRIGGTALRRLSEIGVLQVQEIAHSGGRFSAFDLLSTRGRYEVRTGRAWRASVATHEATIGGTLQESIKREGPYISKDEVFGFVSAAAFNDQGFNYAMAQETGTAHNRPQPFLRPALREMHDAIVKDVVNRTAKSALVKALTSSSGARPRGIDHLKRQLKVKLEVDTGSFKQLNTMLTREFERVW